MNETIESAKAEFLQARSGLLKGLSTTPDDRLEWSPSPTARTPLHLVAHAAEVLDLLHRALNGEILVVPSPEALDRTMREHEKTVVTRAAAIDLFEEKANGFVAWLDALDPSDLGRSVQIPFAGAMPIEGAIGFSAFHTRWHQAQLEYLQTAYGDLDWHM